ncbi:uncharacterized protein LOC118199598 [Stegodyphus dumicola]|uniref:uncharacterized protein LOC118199598 n=1 Tax=Stegodyphus dumicola TaxID=202533 RepID=UPI0015B2D0ED|nr:uncharacterized protein LOC118199598 [Stegodyphus dumicola]
MFQNSVFGYLVTGTVKNTVSYNFTGLTRISEEDSLEHSIKKFFELESFQGDDTNDDSQIFEREYCEQHFMATHKRNDTGRFIVRLPIKEGKRSSLGESKSMAERRLNSLWNKLDKNQIMSVLYTAFMDEYFALNHMEKVTSDCENCSENYYIPHHAVFLPEGPTIPLHVVFDASAKCANGVSLNSLLLNGVTVQQDLFSIVTRF